MSSKYVINGIHYYRDMDGKTMEIGHIVAVRYVWNSYVGTIQIGGLTATSPARRFAFNKQHRMEEDATYQILGHVDINHPDWNEEVFNWYNSEVGECPVEVRIG